MTTIWTKSSHPPYLLMAYNAGVSFQTMNDRGPSRQDTYLNNEAFDYAVHNLVFWKYKITGLDQFRRPTWTVS